MGIFPANGTRCWPLISPRIKRHYIKFIPFVLVFTIISLTYFRDHLPYVPKKHRISSYDIEVEESFRQDRLTQGGPNGFLPRHKAKRYCKNHNWAPYPYRETRRKIYDLFLINTELDWLEIRLNELQHHVDYFVILESATTFTGHPKPLTLHDNWDQFSKFHSKIIYHLLEDPPSSNRSWDHEIHQRNAMYSQVLPKLEGEQEPKEGDVILVSDIDEIPRPATLTLLRNCDFPRRLTLRSRFYYYSFQWLHRGAEWAHPQATTFSGVNSTILPQDLRGGHGIPLSDKMFRTGEEAQSADLWNAAWHCSSCFKTIGELLGKMESFSHTEYNEERFRERERIVDRVRKGKDLWDRWGQWYDRVEDNEDVPSYLKEEDREKRFGYMLDRDGVGAGFADYEER
jgi:beta-1,4-mannosyl-glycoprotein beta-1,4-N-acetylglucosaminyltransferase